jgi:hypothetical protein
VGRGRAKGEGVSAILIEVLFLYYENGIIKPIKIG